MTNVLGTIKALVSTIMLIIGEDCCSWNIYKIFFFLLLAEKVFLSSVWRRLSVTSDHPLLLLPTPLQVRPLFPVQMGIVSHIVSIK